MEYPGRLIAGFIALILIVLFPLQYIAQMNSEDIDGIVSDKTKEFADTVRTKGYIDQDMYEEYINFLNQTGEFYDVEIEDIHPVAGEDDISLSKTDIDQNNGCLTDLIDLIDYRKINKIIASPGMPGNYESGSAVTVSSSTNSLTGYNKVSVGSNGTDSPVILVAIFNSAANIKSAAGGTLYYSLDKGITWNCALKKDNYEAFTDITYGGGKFIAFTTKGNMYYSSDGVNWSCVERILAGPASYPNVIYQVVYRDGIFYATGGNNYNLYTSTDGFNWTQRGKIAYDNLTLANGMIFSTPRPGQRMDSFYYIEPGSYEVKEAELPQTGTYREITYCHGRYYVIEMSDNYGGLMHVWSTTDFINWNDQPRSIIESSDLYPGGVNTLISISDSEFYAFGGYSTLKVIEAAYVRVGTEFIPSLHFSKLGDLPRKTDFHYGEINIYIRDKAVYTYDGEQFYYLAGTIRTSKDLVTWTDTGANPLVCDSGQYRTAYKMVCNADNGCGAVRPAKTLISISASPSSQTIDRLSSPSFTVTANYNDGSSVILDSGYTVTGFDSGITGSQTVTISYTENDNTKSCTVTVNVNGLTSISVVPAAITAQRYTPPDFLKFTVTASYLYGANKTITSGYIVTGYQPSLLGQQTVTISYTERGITKSATALVNVTVLKKECPICHNIYDLGEDDTDYGCPYCKELVTGIRVTPEYVEVSQGDSLPVTVEAVYNNGALREVYGWTSNYNPDKIGIQTVTIEYCGYAAEICVNVQEAMITCPECGTKYPASAGECPVCSERVISINVVPDKVTVKQNESIDITVTAFFANGSSREVNDWTIDRTSDKAGIYKATVTYKTASATIDLTVLAASDTQCPICGYIYIPAENPNGCPICFTALTGIEAYLLSGSDKVQYGTTPPVGVVLIFRDEHRELITDGYTLENYNPFILGIQTVTVKYRGFSANLTLELVNTLSSVICPNGHVYYLNEDGTDPGCPYCRQDNQVNTVYYYDITYSSEILDTVYSAGTYHFKKGNYVTIRLIKRDKSLLYKLQNMFFKTSMLGRKKVFIFGGEVHPK